MILILYPTHFGTFDGGREGAGCQALFCVLFCYVLFFIFKSVIAKFMTMMIIFMEGPAHSPRFSEFPWNPQKFCTF